MIIETLSEVLMVWGPLGLIAALVLGYYCLAFASRPSDGPRIKRDHEGPGRRVVRLERSGWEFGGRYRPSYRKYQITVDDDVRGQDSFTVGVQLGWFGDQPLKVY